VAFAAAPAFLGIGASTGVIMTGTGGSVSTLLWTGTIGSAVGGALSLFGASALPSTVVGVSSALIAGIGGLIGLGAGRKVGEKLDERSQMKEYAAAQAQISQARDNMVMVPTQTVTTPTMTPMPVPPTPPMPNAHLQGLQGGGHVDRLMQERALASVGPKGPGAA